MSLTRRLRIARGDEPADLVLRNARVVNVVSGEIYSGDVVVADGRIVTIGAGYEGRAQRDLGERYLIPGLIDGHMHLESTMMVMGQFARTVGPHGTATVDEAREKLRLGLWLMVREGSTARNLEALLPLLDELRPSRALFVTDDRDPVDLAARGHVDSMVRAALDFGLDPVLAIRLASYNAAQYFGLDDCGAIAPGYRADLLVVDGLRSFIIGSVY